MNDETILAIAGAAVVAGLIIRHKIQTMNGAQPAVTPTGPIPIIPGLPPPQLPVTTTTTTPATSTTTTTTAPAATVTAAPENAAFDASMKAAHAAQADDFAAGAAALKAKVASGEVQPGSDAYNSTMDYLANLRGGVAAKGAGYADLAAAGLAGAPTWRSRRAGFRLV